VYHPNDPDNKSDCVECPTCEGTCNPDCPTCFGSGLIDLSEMREILDAEQCMDEPVPYEWLPEDCNPNDLPW
jgi:hypothetical protein